MRRIFYVLPFVLIFFCPLSSAQKQGNIWHFGHGNALDFNSGSPVQIPSSIWTIEGCATLCNASGQVLFYTNGGGRDPLQSGQSSGKIWNAANDVMYDMGFAEGGGFSSYQSSVILPRPGSPGQYYLFTMEEIEFTTGGDVPSQPQGRGFSYYLVDMSQNGGLGAVTSYTPMVSVPTYEGLCAVRHQNGTDYWVLINDPSNGSIRVYLLDHSGVAYSGSYTSGNFGYIKGSTDGKLLVTNNVDGLSICQFNDASGEIQLLTQVSTNGGPSEFSPNSRYLYFLDGNSQGGYALKRLFLPDINTPAFLADSIDYIGGEPGLTDLPGQMQVAPDHNIYFVTQRYNNVAGANDTYIHAIHCPNGVGAALQKKLFTYPRDGTGESPGDFFGLPNFDNRIFYHDDTLSVDLGADTVFNCSNAFSLDAGNLGLHYLWSNGETGQQIQISLPGVYAVTVSDDCGAHGVDSVRITNGLSLHIGVSGPPCTQSATLEAVASGGILPYEYLWSTGQTASVLDINQSGAYGLTVTDGQGCVIDTAVSIQVAAAPEAVYGVSQPACAGEASGAIELSDVLGGIPPFTLEIAETGDVVQIDSAFVRPSLGAGAYHLMLMDIRGCTDSDTLLLEDPVPVLVSLGLDTTIRLGNSVQLLAHVSAMPAGATIEWLPATGLSCTDCLNPIATPVNNTGYICTLTYGSGCMASDQIRIEVDKEHLYFVPNIFSPDGDGINDYFGLFSGGGFQEVERFAVFDRWGNLVFERQPLNPDDNTGGWDGNFRGKQAESGVYTWFAWVRYVDGNSAVIRGDVMLMR